MRISYVEMPVDDWLSEWMPGETPPILAQSDIKKFDASHLTFDLSNNSPDMVRIAKESELHLHMCKVVQNIFDLVATMENSQPMNKLVVMESNSCPERSHDNRCSYNLIYEKADADNLIINGDTSCTSFSTCVTGIELKMNSRPDPWSRDLKPGRFTFSMEQQACKDRAQICQKIMEIESRQHRRFTFMVFILNNTARFLAFDRVATIASTSFDYMNNPKPLQAFFYRLAISDRYARGYDPTVSIPRPDDIHKLRTAISNLPESDYSDVVKGIISDSLDPQYRLTDLVWPLSEVTIFDQSDVAHFETNTKAQTYRFLVGKPVTPAPSLFGRATKGFVAFDPSHTRFVFLKDSWRSESSRPEWETYHMLAAANVKHIPTLVCGGDVRVGPELVTAEQRTRTQDIIRGRTSKGKIHTRLVILEIGQPLGTFLRTWDLVAAIVCALGAHSMAWALAKVLHRDISDNNILLLYTVNKDDPLNVGFRAILIDWDLSKHEDDLTAVVPKDINRSGTWAFMSALRQKYPTKPYEVSDDIESFVHVLIWCATRYLDHTYSENSAGLATFIHDTFVACEYSSDGTYVGCSGKWKIIESGKLPFTFPNEYKFQTVLSQVLKVCRLHYEHVDHKKLMPYLPSDKVSANRPEYTPGTTKAKPTEFRVHTIVSKPSRSIDASLRVDSDLPSDPLAQHEAIYNMLMNAIEDAGAWPSRLPKKDHLSTIKGVVFTNGKTIATGTKSSRKRQRLPSVTDSKEWKRKCGTSGTSSIRTSGSGFDATWGETDPVNLVLGTDDDAESEEVMHILTASSDVSEGED